MTERPEALSRHFGLAHFLVDAKFPELVSQLEPARRELQNLERLAKAIDLLVDTFGGTWKVLSGFRDARLNDALRAAGFPASVDSLHLAGCAADLMPDASVDLEGVFAWLGDPSRSTPLLHEVVYYPKKGFIHVAVEDLERPTPRRVIMRT